MAGSQAARAIGIVRVSRTNKREGERFASPHIQRERIEGACKREGLELLEVAEELDVSGGKPLDERSGLGPAVKAIEEGRADVIVGAYFDRLFRSIKAQEECVERVERAGGRVFAVDVGAVSNKSAGQWLSGALLGVVAEYHRRTSAERVHGALERAIRRGVPPHGFVTSGYRKRWDGKFEPDPEKAPVVTEAFAMRAAGRTVDEVWKHLRAGGIMITYGGAYALLSSRVVLGEIHFGKFEPNLAAHPPIVDRDTWNAVQRMRSPKGRHSKSDRLLARLGVLVCGSCGSKLAASTARGSTSAGGGGGRTYPIYRCGDRACLQPVSIMAEVAEGHVVSVVCAAGERKKAHGAAAINMDARAAEASAREVRARLDGLIRAFGIVGSNPVAVEVLKATQAECDLKEREAERLGRGAKLKQVDIADWDNLSLGARRDFIADTLASVSVAPGTRGRPRAGGDRGESRLSFEFRL